MENAKADGESRRDKVGNESNRRSGEEDFCGSENNMSIEEELIFSVSIIGERKREANQEKKDGGGGSGQIGE